MMGRALLVVGAVATLGLVAAAVLGYLVAGGGHPELFRFHLLVALAAALLLLFSHCWILFYLIGTGKAIREAVAEYRLDPNLVAETRRFKQLSSGPLTFAMLVAMALFVVGGGVYTGAVPVWVHHTLFWAALVTQAFAMRREARVLAANERLMASINRLLETEGAVQA